MGPVSSGYHSGYGRPQQVRLRHIDSWRVTRPGPGAHSGRASDRKPSRCASPIAGCSASIRARSVPASESSIAMPAASVMWPAAASMLRGRAMVVRLQRIYAAVSALVGEHRPDMIAIERVFLHRNPDSALKLGQARGVALCAAASQGASVHEYAAARHQDGGHRLRRGRQTAGGADGPHAAEHRQLPWLPMRPTRWRRRSAMRRPGGSVRSTARQLTSGQRPVAWAHDDRVAVGTGGVSIAAAPAARGRRCRL